MIIDCVADCHGFYPTLEGGDLLIVAGDLTARDTIDEYLKFNSWLNKQQYQRKIVIAGNHDNLCQKGLPLDSGYGQIPGAVPILADKAIYLCDSGAEFEGFKIWGSPWTKTFPGMNPKCKAFTCDTEEELAEKWMLIPRDTNILITHSPSFGNYDWVKNPDGTIGPSVGSPLLWMWMLSMVPHLKLHITGHIHEAYGHSVHANGIHLVNCSHVNEYYKPVNKPIRVIL